MSANATFSCRSNNNTPVAPGIDKDQAGRVVICHPDYALQSRGDGLIGQKTVAAFALCAMVLSLPTGALAETVVCSESLVSVTAPNASRAQSVCTTVMATLPKLAQCDLQLSHPLSITVLNDLPGVSDTCFGYYVCDGHRIFVRSPGGIAEITQLSRLYKDIAPEVVFDSIVVHEVSHAAFEQTACEDALCLANHEYVAYVMQMWSFPLVVRQKIVEQFGQDEPVEPIRLNDLIAVIAPEKFAALAWQHFNQPGNGCDFVGALVTGNVSLEILWQ